jgi:hypothetical protein
MSMRMVLRSSDDRELFGNTAHDFKVQLDKQTLLNEHLVVALTEINLGYIGTSKIIKDLYVYSNVCKDTIVGKSETSLLRTHINKDSTNQIKIQQKSTLITNLIFDTAYYVPVHTGELDQIYVYIKDEHGQECSFLNRQACVVLHFKRFPLIQ